MQITVTSIPPVNVDLDQKQAFNAIYSRGEWTEHFGQKWEYFGGGGSGVGYTESLRAQLPAFFKRWNVKTFLDASCGEFTWARYVDWTGINYIGGDIVKGKIDKLKKDFPQHTWYELDVINDPLPDADVWMCRDTTFHFPMHFIQKTFRNFLKSNIKYILTTSHQGPWDSTRHRLTQEQVTQNIPLTKFGDFMNINLFKAPFNFPVPLDRLDDTNYIVCPLQRELVLFDRETIASIPFVTGPDIPLP
jgi:hypothetical protein